MAAIYDITPFTALDFPGRLACIFWFAGCNMRCLYCHNPEILSGKGQLSEEEALSFLVKRQGLLDGVVLSGGECTLHPCLITLCRDVKEIGYDVKIDTNGCRPKLLAQLLNENLVDFVALDYKAAKDKFSLVTGGNDEHKAFQESLSLLCSQNAINYEIRTTIHSSLIDGSDIYAIQEEAVSAGYTGVHYLQDFRFTEHTPGKLKAEDHRSLQEWIPTDLLLQTEIR
jgi:pyruvate formate lyase activating enzyme